MKYFSLCRVLSEKKLLNKVCEICTQNTNTTKICTCREKRGEYAK